MRILPVEMSVQDMLGGIADSAGIEEFELVCYEPRNDEYKIPPVGVEKYPASGIRRLDAAAYVADMVEKSSLEGGQKNLAKEGATLGVTSRVWTKNGLLYLPQADFDKVSEGNEESIHEFLVSLNRPGYLIASGDGYHFQGCDLLDYRAWQFYMDLLGSLDTFRLHDSMWRHTSIAKGRSVLRISGCYEKPCIPRVVGEVIPDDLYTLPLPFEN